MSTAAPPRHGGRRGRRHVLRWIALGVVVVLLAAAGYVFYNYQRFVGGITHIDAIPSTSQPKHDIDGKDQNILLVGDDHRPANASAKLMQELHAGPDDGENNTDTMMLLHLPADGKKATLISFPRDSWVDIPGHGMHKLNSAFALGSQNGGSAAGARLLVTVIQNLTGLTVDHFVRVSLLGFYQVAKALGPVQVCLNEAVDDPYSGADFPKGVSTLDAKQALAFVRQRHGLPRGDLDREIRQQYFLTAEARKILSAGTLLNPVKLQKVLDALSSSVQTDPGLNVLNLARQMRGLHADDIRTATIPVSGTPTIYVDGQGVDIVQVDTEAIPAFIQKVIGPPSSYVKAKASKPGSVTVTVLNGGGTGGAAGRATQAFADLGFRTGTAGNADTRATTVVRYAPGKAGDAKAVAAHLPGAVVEESGDASDVTVVLGTDGMTVSSTAEAGGSGPGGTDAGSGGDSGSGDTGTDSGDGSGTDDGSGSGEGSDSPARSFPEGTCID